MRSALMASAYDEEVARRDLLVEVVRHGELAAVGPLLQPLQRDAVWAGVEAALLHRPPGRPGQLVAHGGRLVQQEADLHPVAGPLRLELVDRVGDRVRADLD